MRVNSTKALLSSFASYTAARASIGAVAPTITIGAMPFNRTATATGSITISGTTTGIPTSITWSASPSGTIGTVTGDLTNWSTVVSITPDAVGEGIETITFTATNAAGSGTDSETVGFFIPGAHSFFFAQNINGNYNSGIANNDSITTWTNLGSSGFNMTQATASAKPTYKTSVINGQPMLYADGNDRFASTGVAADWNGLSDSTAKTIMAVARHDSDNGVYQGISSTFGTTNGHLFADYFVAAFTGNALLWSGSGVNTANNWYAPAAQYHYYELTKTTTVNMRMDTYSGSVANTNTNAQTNLEFFDATTNSSIGQMTGHMFLWAYYTSVLTSTQLNINKAVAEWCLNDSASTFPIT